MGFGGLNWGIFGCFEGVILGVLRGFGYKMRVLGSEIPWF